MITKNFALRIAGLIFGIVCILHILRLLISLPVYLGNWFLPYWINIMGALTTALLSIFFFSVSFRQK